jgi:O-antigen ligase
MINLNFVRSTEMEIAGLGINLAARMVGLNLLLAVLLAQLVESRIARIALIVIAMISGIGSLLALSRGNWVALIVSAATLVFIMGVKKRYQFSIKQLSLIVIVGIVTMYAANLYFSEYGLSKLQDRAESSITLSDGASGRFDIWRTAYIPFLEKPLFGHGFNTFKQLNEWKHTGAHNAFVLVTFENGLIGLLLFTLILGSVFLNLLNLYRNKDINPIGLGWGMALFVFLGTVSLVDSAVNRKYLWFVLGIISLLIYYYGYSQPQVKTMDGVEPVGEIESANQFV